MSYKYDVFLSHNSKDKSEVEMIAKTLEQEHNLKCWLDKWNLVPGEPWQEALEEAINQCRTIAVFVGPNMISPWENEEMRSMLEERVHNKSRRVIPVLLPGSPETKALRLPRFLKRLTWVDLRAGLLHKDALYILECGIRGVAPKKVVNYSAEISINDTQKNFEKVQLILDGEFSEFNETKQEDLLGVLAALLHVDKAAVRILRTYQGSIVLEIELPAIGATRLLEYFTKGDFRLKKLRVVSVKRLSKSNTLGKEEQSVVALPYGLNGDETWQSVLGQLQMEMPRAAFDTWVRDSRPVSYDNGVLTVSVRNAYARDWLESRLAVTVNRLLAGITNSDISVRFMVASEDEAGEVAPIEIKPKPVQVEVRSHGTALNPRYVFETFVVGAGNRLAHAACQAVVEKPARAYNPLFLYGGVGLGKTHLLHAIGNACMPRGLNVLYISSEEFTNNLISAIRTHTTQAFRENYLSADVLLVDDIQFIAGKETTQEEFFHTFNTLHGQDKQIVVSSDRPPKALVTLEERLRSRFEWGLTADIQAPDLETRLAILNSKAKWTGRSVPDEILQAIARRVQSNVRELEGALNRIIAFADLSGSTLNVELVDIALADLLPLNNDIRPEHVVDLVARKFNLSIDNLLGRDRSRDIVRARQIAMYILREESNFTLPQIGQTLGGRDQAVVNNALEKFDEEIQRDLSLQKQILEIRAILRGSTS